MVTVLTKEVEHYEKTRDELLKTCEGQFVLIKGAEVLGKFPTWDEAHVFGLHRLGRVPFLIKHVVKEEPVYSIPALDQGLLRARF